MAFFGIIFTDDDSISTGFSWFGISSILKSAVAHKTHSAKIIELIVFLRTQTEEHDGIDTGFTLQFLPMSRKLLFDRNNHVSMSIDHNVHQFAIFHRFYYICLLLLVTISTSFNLIIHRYASNDNELSMSSIFLPPFKFSFSLLFNLTDILINKFVFEFLLKIWKKPFQFNHLAECIKKVKPSFRDFLLCIW